HQGGDDRHPSPPARGRARRAARPAGARRAAAGGAGGGGRSPEGPRAPGDGWRLPAGSAACGGRRHRRRLERSEGLTSVTVQRRTRTRAWHRHETGTRCPTSVSDPPRGRFSATSDRRGAEVVAESTQSVRGAWHRDGQKGHAGNGRPLGGLDAPYRPRAPRNGSNKRSKARGYTDRPLMTTG